MLLSINTSLRATAKLAKFPTIGDVRLVESRLEKQPCMAIQNRPPLAETHLQAGLPARCCYLAHQQAQMPSSGGIGTLNVN